jgi:aerobic C4-dicarboxylate transport protein
VFGAFVSLDALQILFFSVLFGAALLRMGPKGAPVTDFLDRLSTVMFGIVSIVVKAAPIGAFGAIAFTVGSFGLASLAPLLKLVFELYVVLALFVAVVLGTIARMYGFSLYRLLAYLREELVLTISMMNSESAFPRLIDKLTSLGCSKGVVGIVMPTGYSMNQDGGMIYLSMAVGFIAQAYNIPLSIYEQLMLLILMMFTSKGVGGVQGAAFIILASTLTATGKLPVEGLGLLLGVDRLLYIMRALGSVIGNSVATVVVAQMEGEFDESRALETYRKVFEKPSLQHI